MKKISKTMLLPLVALVIAGCTATPSKKKKKNSSEEPVTTTEPTSVDPTTATSSPTTTTGGPTTSTPTTSTPIPTTSTTQPVPPTTSTTSAPKPSSSSSSSSQPKPSSSSTSGTPTPEPPSKTKLSYTYDDYHTHNAYGLDNCPLSGSPKLLIIPIWFTDSSSYITSATNKANVKSDIETAYIGSNSDTGWRSVKTYYQEESMNKVTLQATISDWYECGSSASYYGNDDGYLSRTTSLVDTAVSWYFNNNKSDSRKNYDSNGDGFMDGVMLIYGAPDSSQKETLGGNLWAYCYWMDNDASTSNPTSKTFFWASYDFMYNSSKASSRAGTTYGTGDCAHCNIDAHTYIHEMGHVFGLEDYYDYYESTRYCPAGAFSMQDWNMGGHDPYSVMAYGWADPYIPEATTTFTLGDFQSTHDIIMLRNHTGLNSPFDEYILVEFYTPTGLNKLDSDYAYAEYEKGPTQSGFRIWHVDARLTYATGATEESYIWSKSMITNPNYSGTQYGVYHAMANSYGGNYASVLGSSYYDYNLLQFIRKDTSEDYKPESQMTNSDLFKAGDTFSMSTYSKQFKNSGKMNDGNSLGWTVTVNSISSTQASITVTKA